MGYRMRHAFFLALTLLAALLFAVPAAAAGDDYKIEQAYINKPDVVVYFRDPAQNDALEAYLGGEQLTMQERMRFGDSGEAAEYYVLLDISASVPGQRFDDIRASLQNFLTSLRENDRLVLLTFGDAVTTVLTGDEGREEASAAISQLVNRDQNTVLFEAIDTVSDMIWTAGNSSEMHRVVIVISDGKDCADNTRSVESVQNRLIARGIPLYTLAVENNEGDSEVDIADYRGKFGALSRNTGGVPWTISGNSVGEGLDFIRETVMNTQKARFLSGTNEISNQKEDLVLKFTGAGNMSDTVSVLVGRAKPDDQAPGVTAVESTESNSITVTFSEEVLKADSTASYRVKKDGKTIPVQQVVETDGQPNAYTLLFTQDLYEGDYEISFSRITDRSNEKNPLTDQSVVVHTDWEAPEEQVEEEKESEPEPEPETWLDILLKWWPVVLTGIVLLFILIGLLLLRQARKKRSVLVVDGQEIEADHVESHHRVEIKNNVTPDRTKKISLWISNGVDEPKQMEVFIEGSCIVGRSLDRCNVSCDDPTMGRQHFVLSVEEGNLFITDLNSTNGTSVNGVRIQSTQRVNRGDEIMAGSLRFRVDWQDE